jgi:glucose-1-phosphate cytidylyltransferase
MKVVILCGGMGTRIRDHFEMLPKPLIPIGSRPILWHIMKYYAHYGLDDFVLCLGFKRDAFVDYFLHYRYHNTDMTIELGRPDSIQFHDDDAGIENWRVTLADTGLRTSTGARLCRVAKYLDEQTFLLTYGDGVCTVDLDLLIDHHRRSGKLATVSAVHPAGRFGEIEFEDDHVLGFNEKPQTTSGFINGGYMVFEREFIERYLSDDEGCVLEADGLQRCARDGLLGAYRHEGFWQCMDTGREHQILEEMWAGGSAPWRVWNPVSHNSITSRRVVVSQSGHIVRRAS